MFDPHSRKQDDALAVIAIALTLLLKRSRTIMTTLAEMNATLDAVAAGVDALEAAIAALKAEVAAGHVVTQEELDALGAKASAIVADITDTSDQG